MKILPLLIRESKNSKVSLWLLNFLAGRLVPFNKPHSFKIKEISEEYICVELPYKKSNLNHIKGIHACALATLCEYSTGILLLTSLDPLKYRIILKNLSMTYHYQAKKPVSVSFTLTREEVSRSITEHFNETEAVFKEFNVDVFDTDRNHICTGNIHWHIKAWDKVRSK